MSVPPRRAVLSRLTGEGRGALGVIRVTGPDALALVSRAFRPHAGPSLEHTPADRLRVGRIGAGVGDEVVVVWSGDPAVVEIQCHGGRAALAWVSDGLIAEGATVAAGADDSGPPDKPPTFEDEAWRDLAQAPTLRTAEILLEQAEGALTRAVAAIDRDLAAGDPAAVERARQAIRRLLDRAELGVRLLTGWRVVLAGRPNVGKSRLLNALAGYDRAIVAPTPGTTRDVVTVRTAFEGWPVELSDTAGLRESADPVEATGIALARASQAGADLVLLLLDGSCPLGPDDHRLLAEHPASLRVRTKSDLPWAWHEPSIAVHAVSAVTGQGVSDLARVIGRRLVPDPPAAGAAVVFRAKHRGELAELLRTLDAAGAGAARDRLRGWLE